MNQRDEICVFSERGDVALELLAAARMLAAEGTVVSIVVGPDAESGAREHVSRGADVVVVVEPNGTSNPAETELEALRRILAQRDPDVLLVGATDHGTEIASRLAQGLRVGCASECTGLVRENGKLIVERTCLGRFVSRQVIETRPAIATVQPRRFEPPGRDDARSGKVDTLKIEATPTGETIVEIRKRERSSVRIDRAEVVVGVGRGLRSREDLQMIEKLAAALGGVVGASRPLTDDLQWLSSDHKVGLSGVTVKPKLYIACGISGQIEHNVGMRESAVVVAINSDPSAPIMQQADYCITGDLHEIVPALIEAIAELAHR